MKDYREIISNSCYASYDGMPDEDRNDYRRSFLKGMNILLSRVEGETFLLHLADYPDLGEWLLLLNTSLSWLTGI